MLSKALAWKYVLPLLVVVGLVGGASGAAIVHFAFDHEAGLTRGSIVRLGPPERLSTNPFCIEAQHVCVVQLDDEEVIALYTYDPHPFFRSRNCSVRWLPDFSYEDPETGQESKGWFRGDCSGSTFRLNGERIFGPSPRDLDRFDIKVLQQEPLAGYLEVDTTHLICGRDRSDVNLVCDFAPLPQ